MTRVARVLVVGLLGLGASARGQDSVTAACRQRPDYCALLTGREVAPVRGGAELASVAATLRLLEPELRQRVERALEQCAEWADAEVNRRHLGGAAPSRQQCQFPCPPSNKSSWKTYEQGHVHQGESQGKTYAEALKAEAALVDPRLGIQQRTTP